jgi:DNA-binding LytR/AlgR family response regulator
MKIVVVEDEAPARERLMAAIRTVEPEAQILATFSGVADTVEYLRQHGQPDLLFLDIQLSDGSSFDILKQVDVTCPVVFATAFDEYLLEAFQANGVEYLLKPIREEKLAAAFAKYRRLREHFGSAVRARALRDRILVRKGIDYISVRTADVAYAYTEDKLVFIVTHEGVRHMLDRPLGELETGLDPARFFRANRAWLVSIDAVVRCRSYGKGRLLLELKPKTSEEVVVSQERAQALRDWLGG